MLQILRLRTTKKEKPSSLLLGGACHAIGWAIIMLWEQGTPVHDTLLQEFRKKPEDKRELGFWGFQTAKQRRLRLQDRDPQLLRIDWDKLDDDFHAGTM